MRLLRERAAIAILHAFALTQYDWRDGFHQLKNGIHSEIPLCCIIFFITEWYPWKMAYTTPRHPHERDMRAAGVYAERTTPPRYVPCPDCLARHHFVEIHTCTAACAGMPGASAQVSEEDGPRSEPMVGT